MHMKNLVLVVISFIFFSCSKDDGLSKKIIFGAIYGECAGDCRNLYLLTEQGIYSDTNSDTTTEYGNWENTTFGNRGLSQNKFELAKPLLEIPTGLLDKEDEIVVDLVADFDYFIYIELNGKSKTWVFDEINENTEPYIKDYFNTMIQINRELFD